MFRFLAKMAPTKDKVDRRANKTKTENPEIIPQSSGRKKGHGKGMSNIIHVYRNEEKVVTQAEVHSQPESHSQEPQPEAWESHIQESQTQ